MWLQSPIHAWQSTQKWGQQGEITDWRTVHTIERSYPTSFTSSASCSLHLHFDCHIFTINFDDRNAHFSIFEAPLNLVTKTTIDIISLDATKVSKDLQRHFVIGCCSASSSYSCTLSERINLRHLPHSLWQV